MAKVKTNSVARTEKYEMIGEMLDIFNHLKNKREVIGFVSRLLTPSESLMLARRIQVAKMILEGKNYDEIRLKLKVGNGVITKINLMVFADNETFKLQIEKLIRRNEGKKEQAKDRLRIMKNPLLKYPNLKLWADIIKKI